MLGKLARYFLGLGCFFLGGTLGAAQESVTVSLAKAFKLAEQNTEALKIAHAQLEQKKEKLSQALGSFFPTINFLGVYQRQDAPDTISLAVSRPEQSTFKLALTQPLFKGLREFSELRVANKNLKAQEFEFESQRIALLQNVSTAFFAVLTAEKDFEELQTLTDLMEKRLAELKARVHIGRSRKGEYLSALAQSSQLKAQLESSQREIASSRELLAQLTDLPTTIHLEAPYTSLPNDPPPIDEFLQRVEDRPDLNALKQQLGAAEDRVSTAWGGHLPSLDLNANYYFKRTGFLEDVKWDVGLQLNIPLFQGGVIQAQVREALGAKQERELALGAGRRNVLKQIRTQHQTFRRLLQEHSLLNEAAKIADQNYQEQNRDYRYGLVSNLEVLSSLNTLLETKRQLLRSFFSAKLAEISLQLTTGRIPDSLLIDNPFSKDTP